MRWSQFFVVMVLFCPCAFAKDINYEPQGLSLDYVEPLVTVFEKDLPDILKKLGLNNNVNDESVIRSYNNRDGKYILIGNLKNDNTDYVLVPFVILGDNGGASATYSSVSEYYAIYHQTPDGWVHTSDLLLNNSMNQVNEETYTLDEIKDGYIKAHMNSSYSFYNKKKGWTNLKRTGDFIVRFHDDDLTEPFLVWLPSPLALENPVSVNILDGQKNTVNIDALFGPESGHSDYQIYYTVNYAPLDNYVYHQYSNAAFIQKDDHFILGSLVGVPDNLTLGFNGVSVDNNTTPEQLIKMFQEQYTITVTDADNASDRRNNLFVDDDPDSNLGMVIIRNAATGLFDSVIKTPQGDHLFSKRLPWYSLGFDHWLELPDMPFNPVDKKNAKYFNTTEITYTKSIGVEFLEEKLSPRAMFYFYHQRLVAVYMNYFYWVTED
ncbi:hypothetical protein ACIQCX_04240 [Enterobacter cancerogenus]|uniref:hypothetical protein n=1 Tax=Enterobacter cancerogenus TaxID=69218 RepID=UPI0037F9510E